MYKNGRVLYPEYDSERGKDWMEYIPPKKTMRAARISSIKNRKHLQGGQKLAMSRLGILSGLAVSAQEARRTSDENRGAVLRLAIERSRRRNNVDPL